MNGLKRVMGKLQRVMKIAYSRKVCSRRREKKVVEPITGSNEKQVGKMLFRAFSTLVIV